MSSEPPGPDRFGIPGILRAWLRITLRPGIRRNVAGDLEEAAMRRSRRTGRFRARAWLWIQALVAPLHVWRHEPPFPGGLRIGVVDDLRYGIRRLSRRPGVALTVALILSLGIAGTTAVYSIFSPLVWPELPTAEANGLRAVATVPGEPGYFQEDEIEALGRALELPVAGFGSWTAVVQAGPDVIQARSVVATAGFLEVLNAPLALGRLPVVENGGPPAPEVVASRRFFESFFGGRPSAVGSTVEIEGRPYVLVGVTRDGFRGLRLLGAPDLWIPAERAGPEGGFVSRPLTVIFANPASLPDEALEARLAGAISRVQADTLLVTGWADAVIPRGERRAMARVGIFLGLLGALVLLAACANVANVLSAEGVGRKGEVAVRRALGASRGRVVRQLMLEAGLLGAGALALALILATSLLEMIPGWLPDSVIAVIPDLRLSGEALALGSALGVLSVLAAGLVPALSTSREASLIRGLGSRSTARTRGGDALLVVQVGASVMLLVAAGLLARGMSRIRSMDHGFETRDRWTFAADLSVGAADSALPGALAAEFRRELEAVPGVRDATLISGPPLFSRGAVRLPGEPEGSARLLPRIFAGDRYLETMGSTLVAGQGFREGETRPVVMISRDLARSLWPGEEALGRLLVVDGRELRVVGLLAEGSYGFRETRPMVVAPLRVGAGTALTAVVRAEPGMARVAATLRRRLMERRPEAPPPAVTPVSEWFDRAWVLNRALTSLAGVFGVLALVIGLVGIYGRFRQRVARSRREMGIRLALGASRGGVMTRVLGRSAVITGAGIALGTGGALAAARAAEAFLVGVSFADPLTYGVVALAVVASSLLATAEPAIRAAAVDPVQVLREE